MLHKISIDQRILKKFPQKYLFFNIDNNQKCFLSSKSAYYYDFWRSCDTEDWSNNAENTALITEINYILKHIHTEASYFKLYKYLNIFTVFLIK